METTDGTATVKLWKRKVNALIEPPVIHMARDAVQTQIKQGLDFFASRHLEPTVSQFRQSRNPNILEKWTSFCKDYAKQDSRQSWQAIGLTLNSKQKILFGNKVFDCLQYLM